MPTNQDLIHSCDRARQGIDEVKANALRLVQLESEVTRAENTLRGLNAQIEDAKRLAAEAEQVDQKIRQKRSELAELEVTIAKKHEQHGSIVGALRDLRKQISGDPQHA